MLLNSLEKFAISMQKAYWLSKSPQERIHAVEIMRKIIYGKAQSSKRLADFLRLLDEHQVRYLLKINKKASGRLKDLTDLEYLP